MAQWFDSVICEWHLIKFNLIKIAIPQPYPLYQQVKHKIEIPVYKVVPEIIEKYVPYTVEKPYNVEIERPFPVTVIKKLKIPGILLDK